MARRYEKTRKSVRVLPSTRLRKAPRAKGVVPRVSKRARREPAIRSTIDGRRVYPEPKSMTGLCKPNPGRPEKKCFLRPLFVGENLSRRFGVPKGAYLVNCTGAAKKPGQPPEHFIPVKNRRDAYRRGEKFCACRDDGGSPGACAKRVGGALRRRKR